uniref:Defensin-like protein n=1 Tax=Strongyloides stercoralis TaxID=6248 RepID=A0A0K0E5M5_STRER
MKYLFILVVAVALITENKILAGSSSSSNTLICKNGHCYTQCIINGQEVPCRSSYFKDTINVSLCNNEKCQKDCKKEGKKGYCDLTAKIEGNIIENKCICQ